MIQSLKKLLAWFAQSQNANSAGVYISSNGSVARFVFESRKIKADGTPKPGAFDPEQHPIARIFETSVCGLNGVTSDRMWELGRNIRPGKSVIAAIEIAVAKIQVAGLNCFPAPETQPINYPEHGIIVGWDDDKSKRLAAQQYLVANITRTHMPTA